MTKIIKTNSNEDYQLQYDWNDIFVQCNDSGIVLGQNPYTTAFFESFPRKPDTFIRGEGKTIQEAETAAWNKYQKTLGCQDHEYKYHSDIGHGKCIHCNLFTSYALPNKLCCSVCNKEGSYFNVAVPDSKYECKPICLEHFISYVEENYTELANVDNELDAFTDQILLSYHLYKEVLFDLNEKDFYFKLKKESHVFSQLLGHYIHHIFDENDTKLRIFVAMKIKSFLYRDKIFLKNHIKTLFSDILILHDKKEFKYTSYNKQMLDDMELIIKPFILEEKD